MRTQTQETQEHLTPGDAHRILADGNKRFVKNRQLDRDHQEQVLATVHGQYPFAIILSCIDSRVPAELIFDQGIGDIFSVRVAGNILNDDILGSMEFACKITGSKIVVVLGHTKCSAVTAACNKVELGHITTLLKKLKPAVDAVHQAGDEISESEIEAVAIENIKLTIARIRAESPILAELESDGEIEIVGAHYDLSSGVVEFFPRGIE